MLPGRGEPLRSLPGPPPQPEKAGPPSRCSAQRPGRDRLFPDRAPSRVGGVEPPALEAPGGLSQGKARTSLQGRGESPPSDHADPPNQCDRILLTPADLRMLPTSETPSKPIETFVFMDLEATGLPLSQPKIAEMCLFAVSRHSLENPQYSSPCPKAFPLLPRLADKLSVCINPSKPFTPAASSITGLTNEAFIVNKKQSFDLHLLHLMASFFSRQHPPICLVAHNGYGYDFPLLKAELSALGHSALEEIYCADTIKAMKALDSVNNQLHQFAYQPSAPGSRKKYALRDLYFKFYKGYPPNSHNAEGDVIALISIFQLRARDLMCWMDSHAVPFNSIRAMYKENERDVSFSKTPGNIQPFHSNHLQMQSRQRVASTPSHWPFPENGKPADNNYVPLNNRITEKFFIVPDEIKGVKGILILFLGLVVMWVAVKYPV